MADISTPVDLKAPSDAVDFEEYEKLDKSVKAAPPVQEPQAPEEKPSAEPADASKETAGAPEPPKVSQEKGKKPERKPDAEHRIAELTREKRELERKLAEVSAKGVTQVSPPATDKPAATPPTAAAVPSADAEPDLAKYIEQHPQDTFAQVQARFNRDHFAWLHKQAQAETDKRQQEARDIAVRQEAIAKRPDVSWEDIAGRPGDPNSGISLYNFPTLRAHFPNLLDVLYHLHDNPSEYQRVRALPPVEQYGEVLLLSRQLKAGPPAPAPEKVSNVRPMVSRLPAPQKTILSGTMPASKKSLSDATSFEEAEEIDRRRRSG